MQPFTVDVPEAALADLRDRLRRTRWPDRETVDDWSQGVPLAVMQQLCAYWRDDYNWRRCEARLNSHPQFITRIDGLDIHFLHVRSPNADATPLLLTHGWPGSVVEFLDVIEPLVDPTSHGGRVNDAFHLVIPSVPGYGFSAHPTATGWGIERIAAAWAELMRRLGYDRYGAAGGDWGTSISTVLAKQSRDAVLGIHLTPPLVAPDWVNRENWTAHEHASAELLEAATRSGAGYTAQHSTRPQTLGYALLDSPAGQCAWIFEKFVEWSDHDGDVFSVLSPDQILDNITLYWLTRTGASSTRLYWESIATVNEWFTSATTDTVDVPTGASVFKDTPRPSRRWAEQRFTDIRYWSEPERGGHFAAFEQPALFVDELRASFAAIAGS
ncbi:epoxide hydrolase family protein [Mycolicibacterium arseniciresistens]|uniref:Epoxide hydrolase n=1 Tax=Mycolicibacterium arseniciresistens TaxID=3062257 RepID=A0ABT8UBH2_9MYCO|nr:epoxide hydrolase family protein [Mycolicibacterium arseniciresistens]MDO3635139.1 epoxide hydrolase [Mycolicibacterium arseniciresistens]